MYDLNDPFCTLKCQTHNSGFERTWYEDKIKQTEIITKDLLSPMPYDLQIRRELFQWAGSLELAATIMALSHCDCVIECYYDEYGCFLTENELKWLNGPPSVLYPPYWFTVTPEQISTYVKIPIERIKTHIDDLYRHNYLVTRPVENGTIEHRLMTHLLP